MEEGKEKWMMLRTNEGEVSEMGTDRPTVMDKVTGKSTAVEQQLQTQKGEQWSSLQVLECCSWSEKS